MADPKPAAGGSSGSSPSSSGSGGSGASEARIPKWFKFIDTFGAMFGHQVGDAIRDHVSGILKGRTERQQKEAVRLPNFGHIMTQLEKRDNIVFAKTCDLMQFLASDDDRADMQYHIAGIGGDEHPEPSVEFLIQLAGRAKSTGVAGLQEMKDYLTQLGYIGPRAEDHLEKAQRYAKEFGIWAKDLPGEALDAAKTQLTAAIDGMDAAVAASPIPQAAADFRTRMAARKARARARWR